MTERPGSLGRLDRLLAAATIAHQRIADLHARQPDELSLALLRESADIVLRQMHDLAAGVRARGRIWAEQELLDPERAAETLRQADTEMAEIEDDLRVLLTRQEQIARELQNRG